MPMQVLKFHVAVGVYTQYLLPITTGNDAGTPLNTLLTPNDPTAVLLLRKAGKSKSSNSKLVVFIGNPTAKEQSKVIRFNLTFAGDYVDGNSSYVVHAIDKPLVLTPGTYATVDKFLASQKGTTKISARYFKPLIKTILRANGTGTVRGERMFQFCPLLFHF
jgi:hypothetical protein